MCIRDRVNHVRFYLDVMEEYMLATRAEQADWASSWQVGAVTEEEWARLKAELQASYCLLYTSRCV